MVLIHVLEGHCSYHSHPFLAGYTEKRIHRHTSNADMSDMLTRIAYRISGNFGKFGDLGQIVKLRLLKIKQ